MGAGRWTKLLAVAAICSVSALADHGGDDNGNNQNNSGGKSNAAFSSGMAGSVPNVTIGGVASGGVPWTVQEGSASISAQGRIHVQVTGLLIVAGPGVPANLVGTVGPVQMVAASVVCGGSGGSVMASTDGVALSPGGNAEIEGSVTLPSSCMAPSVLLRIFTLGAAPGSQLGRFIAVNGLNSSGAGAQNAEDKGLW